MISLKILAMIVGNIVGKSSRVNEVRGCSIYEGLQASKEACIETRVITLIDLDLLNFHWTNYRLVLMGSPKCVAD